ncbi:MAG: hypothetical protein M1812_003779 [Candelaria pacifica]|nr:MAG: hypothetical protein M1812_003779 [Candelaria pacifica]
MVAKKKRSKKSRSLSHGRPPIIHKPPAALSSKATRTLIRSHHALQKAIVQAISDGDTAKAEVLQAQLKEQGGLKSYQQASITGQSSERGGDSSKLLMEWLESSLKPLLKQVKKGFEPLRLLEVGALSKSNACSRSSLFAVTRIDLNSQDESIVRQDFMQRPLPASDEERFDLISLSLVLNYVPDAVGRGDMLWRTTQFLRTPSDADQSNVPFPSLFLVLPASCVTNSRYLDEKRLTEIMESLGYLLAQRKVSTKLAYYLWRRNLNSSIRTEKFKKIEVNSGRSRNNFAVVLA